MSEVLYALAVTGFLLWILKIINDIYKYTKETNQLVTQIRNRQADIMESILNIEENIKHD